MNRWTCIRNRGFPGVSVVKNPPASVGDAGLIPGSEGSPGVGNGNPLQYSCLRNPMDRGAWWAHLSQLLLSQLLLLSLLSQLFDPL